MQLNAETILVFISSAFSFSLFFILIFNWKNNLEIQHFSIFSLMLSIWTACVGINLISRDINLLFYSIKLSYILGCSIAFYYNICVSSYIEERIINKKNIYMFVGLILLVLIILMTDNIINIPIYLPHLGRFGWAYGNFWFLFDLLFIFMWSNAFYSLYKYLIKSKNYLGTIYLLVVPFICLIPAYITGIFLPAFHCFDYTWICPLSTIFWFLLTTYAIYRHELLRARVYFLQVFVSVTWIIMALMAIAKWHETGATVASVTSISLLSLSFFTLFMVKKEMDMDRDLDRTERLLVAQLPESIRIMFARNVKERFDIYFEREIMLDYFENLTKNFHNSRRV